MPDTYICGRLRWTKITRKASDAAEYIELFGSIYIGGRSENNIKCIVHDDLRVKESNNSIYSAASLALRVIFSVS